jgi:hypothetical protein
LQRTSDVQRAVERLFRPIQAAKAHADLSEGRQGHSEAVRRTAALLQFDAPLCQRQRLLVTMLHERNIGLVAADGREHVARLDQHRQAFGLGKRGHRLVQPAFLRERDAGEGVDHREMASVADSVQSGCGLRQMFANDGGVTNLAIAKAEFEVGKTDGARVVRSFRRVERLGQERDAARRFPACRRKPAVHAPEVRKAGGIETLARFGRSPKRFGRLSNIILQQPRVGQGAAHLNLLVAAESRLLQRAHEQRRRIRAASLFERLERLT